MDFDFDYAVVGSGFGGSVAALRLAERGYRVVVLEKGRRLAARDFPKRNWNLRRWLWLPALRFFGLFKITIFRHVMVLSGVGVGGGSLVYANTLARPNNGFYRARGWAGLADWEAELAPHMSTVLRMLGAAPNPQLEPGDRALGRVADEIGRRKDFAATTVAVHFGREGESVADPYLGGKGPPRTGCVFCGGCMTGCRFEAKNTLDRNYLYLAESLAAEIRAECEVIDIRPLGDGAAADGTGGYRVMYRRGAAGLFGRKREELRVRGVVLAGGVLGTVPLLLSLRRSSLPRISPRIGHLVRTNSESLIGVTVPGSSLDYSRGVAIGSILRVDPHTTLEAVRYAAGSGIWRLLMAPLTRGGPAGSRAGEALWDLLRHPLQSLRVYCVDDWARRTQILLFMQTVESTLRLVIGRLGVKSEPDTGPPPSAFIPQARELALRYARVVGGKPMTLISETLSGIPTTAHILGGAVIADSPSRGVVDERLRVFGYRNLFVCDGSVVPANPGVNPALTIAALAERAMSFVQKRMRNPPDAP